MRRAVEEPPRGEDLALGLPWDRLRTPGTPFAPARLEQSRRILLTGVGATGQRDVRLALAVAAATALSYRYSGQVAIPLALRLDDRATCQILTVPVTGAVQLGNLLGSAGAALAEARPGGTAAPLCLHVRFADRGGIEDRSEDDAGTIAGHDVSLEVTFEKGSATLSLLYDAALFSVATASRLLAHFAAIVAQLDALAPPSVAAIEIHSPREHVWLREHCHGSEVGFAWVPVHHEIAMQARKTPERIAVRCNEKTLTYGELERRAEVLAGHLVARGAQHRTAIVCLEPSLDIAVALLGVLKAGAAYVPVNPSHPEYRIRAILEDTRPALVITSGRAAEAMATLGVELLDLGSLPVPESGISDAPPVDVQPGQLAYVYYTSGSTGQPKGVAGTHANLRHIVDVSRLRYGLDGNDVVPAVAAFTFSISLFELTAPLTVGGTLLVLERDHVLDPARMTATLEEVTFFHIGPSLLRSLVRHIRESGRDPDAFRRVRHASSGGDMVPPGLLQELQAIFTRAEIYVIYGCSEVGLMGCTWDCTNECVERTYVGKPFANVRLLVLDEDDNPLPAGVIGNVCFGGPGVVDGYVNHELEANTLFFERDGMRFYRTGDRGRLNERGELELLGRRDFQLKLRGMRIELGEVDYHLRQAPGVREGVCAGQTNSRGEPVLVAYYIPDGSGRANRYSLQAHLASRLPDYMVPRFYMELQKLPLNHNLKLDRRQLPVPPEPAPSSQNMPVSETEVALARVWCDLLQLDTVSVDDNFMLLGGNSLLAMEMIQRVKQSLGYRLDGMDVLRESLWILARTIDDSSGHPAAAVARQLERRIWSVTSFHFGQAGELYGLYSPSTGPIASSPVLVCSPIGFEYTRCQFLLRTLMERLAESGAASLRFDFYGSGDSLGRDVEASPARWRADLRAALDELRRRTGAPQVRVFGLRLASLLALEALPADAVQRWVFWDPVTSGESWYRDLARITRAKVDKLMLKRNLRRVERRADSEELVGTRYSAEALRELRALELHTATPRAGADLRLVLSSDFALEDLGALASVPRIATGVECGWHRSSRVTVAITSKELLDGACRALMEEEC
jgi:amino acid adenylation domain-containing protein